VSWAFGWSVAVLENNNFTLKALFFPPDFGEGIDVTMRFILASVFLVMWAHHTVWAYTKVTCACPNGLTYDVSTEIRCDNGTDPFIPGGPQCSDDDAFQCSCNPVAWTCDESDPCPAIGTQLGSACCGEGNAYPIFANGNCGKSDGVCAPTTNTVCAGTNTGGGWTIDAQNGGCTANCGALRCGGSDGCGGSCDG
jgi:hypothetical protein